MPYCYILYSEKLNRFYTGICQDDVNERINKHNDQSYGKHRFTAKAKDWQPYISIKCESMSHARRVEIHIKRMKSAQYIRNLRKYPHNLDRLRKRYL